MTKRFSFLCVFLVGILLGCSVHKNSTSSAKSLQNKQQLEWQKRADKNIEALVQSQQLKLDSLSDYEHMRWVAKASLFLRGQKELSSETDDLQKLQSLSREQVVELFLKSDEFYNTVGDFALFYLGFRIDPLFVNHRPHSRVYNFNQVVTSVISLAHNKSFFSLFETNHPVYTPPFLAVDDSVLKDLGILQIKPLSNLEKRRLIFETVIKKSKTAQQLTDDELKKDESNLCSFFSVFNNNFNLSAARFSDRIGISNQTYDQLERGFITTPFYMYCTTTFSSGAFSYTLVNTQAFREYLPEAIDLFDNLLFINSDFDSSVYQVKTLEDIKPLHLKTGSFNSHFYSTPEIHSRLPNSSTNMNRKRGAYVLKNFFCDDLTPVNVQIVDDHAGAHGSNPSCFACHYKLDPMAGFFKNYGFFFTDFKNSDELIFDDFKNVNKEEYQKQWLKPGTQEWNIGYIQSTKLPHLNQYGESLDDLHQILKTHPEVKKCLTKRVLEYSTEPSQLYDSGFIQDLAQSYIQEEKMAPAEAFKNLFRKAALSKTFAAENRTPTECYDLKQGVDPATRPPCEVAHILESQCVRCHKSTTGLNSLDLSKWVDTGFGKMGFAHLNETTGQQIEPQKTFSTMLERITSSDEDLRMPPGDMNPVYRQILFKWLSQKQGE